MILFLCYGSPHLNRFVSGVVAALAENGVPALTVALDGAARSELRAEGLDPLPLFPHTPLAEADEAEVEQAVRRFVEAGEVPASVLDLVGGLRPARDAGPGSDGRRAVQRLRMALRSEITATQLLERLHPAAVVLWNGWTPGTGPLRRRAAEAGVPTWFIERGPFPGTVQLDAEGINAGASFARWAGGSQAAPDSSQRWAESVLEAYRGSTSSAWEQPDPVDETRLLGRLGVDRSTRLVLFPCQVREDVNIQRFASRFERYEEVYDWLGAAYRERPGVVVVAKRHPKSDESRDAFERALGGRGRWVEEVNIRQLLALSDHVVSINSTVALEAMVSEKPAVVLGSTFYAGPGAADREMAFTADGPAQLRAVADRILAGDRRPNGTRRGVIDLMARLHAAGHLLGADDAADRVRTASVLRAGMSDPKATPDAGVVALLRELGELRCTLQELEWRRQRARGSWVGRVLRFGALFPGLRGLAELLAEPDLSAGPTQGSSLKTTE